MASEFELIRQYFLTSELPADVSLGVGDDAALLNMSENKQLVVTVDTLISAVHFPASTSPEDIGHKALAVNLSDLAAMGAEPKWVTLALSLPEANETWISAFAKGFRTLAEQHNVTLVGGDTTRGPLSITVQAMGWVNRGEALLRSSAQAGDHIYVSGSIGDAGLALKYLTSGANEIPEFLERYLNSPEPRISLGMALPGVASACIDISDGVLADLGHILESSGRGAELQLDAMPYSNTLQEWIEAGNNSAEPLSWGDDYELLFTAAPEKASDILSISEQLGLPITRIGAITEQPGLRLFTPEGALTTVALSGYDHFGNGT